MQLTRQSMSTFGPCLKYHFIARSCNFLERMSHCPIDDKVFQAPRTVQRMLLHYMVAQAKNGGIQVNGTMLYHLADLVLTAIITTGDEYLLRFG